MTEPSFHQQSVYWGQVYETLVKRGGIYYLAECGLIKYDRPSLSEWSGIKVNDLTKAMYDLLYLSDLGAQELVTAAVEHMALTAFGTGYTAMRAYLEAIGKNTRNFNQEKLTVKALWCPITMPGKPNISKEEFKYQIEASTEKFAQEFSIDGLRDPYWAEKGQPVNADFILWLDYAGKENHLLVQEYSFDMPNELQDFRDQAAHLAELGRHRRVLDSRGVFARITAEVDHEHFELSDDIRHYLLALTSENKPLYKLCQASSYTASTVELLMKRCLTDLPINARSLAITPNGLEGLGARISKGSKDPRFQLMKQLANAYCDTKKSNENDETALTKQAEKLFMGTVKKLPKSLRQQMQILRGQMPKPGQDFEFSFKEKTSQFNNPDQTFTLEHAINLIPDKSEINHYFGGNARTAIALEMASRLERKGRLSLRDIHASAIVAGLQRGVEGRINLIALEGNPGIGKTTAVREHLATKSSGYLLIYLSPRVIINRDVTSSLARTDGKPTGILTLTSNAQLIATAENWHKKQIERGLAEPRKIDSAVVTDGIVDLQLPINSTLVLTPEQEQEIEDSLSASSFWKTATSEYEDTVKDRQLPGVLKTLSNTARELLRLNPQVNRLVLTAALQGFKERANQKTTIDALSGFFKNKRNTLSGVEERRKFARTAPTIIVMVDELTGDGAGAPFVHAISDWLYQEFIGVFEDEEVSSPFTVTLIVSDASLGNEVVLERYLNAGDRTPDKILVSPSRGQRPFDLAVTQIGLQRRNIQALHVMTNSFPASELTLRYAIRMKNVNVGLEEDGSQQTVRQAIREQSEEVQLNNACTEIKQAIAAGAAQVIYFAQDKQFLRAIKEVLSEHKDSGLDQDAVQVLDSSVPGYERKRLVEPSVRDKIRVFLMTSSGARGVSFPKTDWIIANVPRFQVEAQLMEIAQLIYRGRGKIKDADGSEINGDTIPRTLVFTVDDYLVNDGEIQERQWLRQSIDLMTLLVMLRSTVFTRITGDSGLPQPLALVPVGAVGTEEIISLMSQYVSAFIKEASLYRRKSTSKDLSSLVSSALDNVLSIFTRTDLKGEAKKNSDVRSYTNEQIARNIFDVAGNSIRSLIPKQCSDGTLIPAHMYFCGPVVIENWESFDKQEVFAFEEHDQSLSNAVRQLKGQLYSIKGQRAFPTSLRYPAETLLELLYREKHDEANEFKTLKALKSPNTWVALPSGYPMFMSSKNGPDDRSFCLNDEVQWHSWLSRTLGQMTVIPPIALYKKFPWTAAVGRISPLNLDLVFDDRYFMASNELNLLNTLLLSRFEPED